MKYFIGGAILGAVLMSTYIGMVYYTLNEEEFAVPPEMSRHYEDMVAFIDKLMLQGDDPFRGGIIT